MASYRTIHEYRIVKARGRAADHDCVAGCGRQAEDWAYQHTSEDPRYGENGRVYSEDPQDYEPMCRSCHIKLDGLPLYKRMEADPEFAEQMREFMNLNGATAMKKRRSCDGCGRTMAPAHLGNHQKSSGHVGWKDLG